MEFGIQCTARRPVCAYNVYVDVHTIIKTAELSADVTLDVLAGHLVVGAELIEAPFGSKMVVWYECVAGMAHNDHVLVIRPRIDIDEWRDFESGGIFRISN